MFVFVLSQVTAFIVYQKALLLSRTFLFYFLLFTCYSSDSLYRLSHHSVTVKKYFIFLLHYCFQPKHLSFRSCSPIPCGFYISVFLLFSLFEVMLNILSSNHLIVNVFCVFYLFRTIQTIHSFLTLSIAFFLICLLIYLFVS